MESILIMCNKGPFGTNSVYEAIRLGSGFIALGEMIDCKIYLYGEAVLCLRNNLQAEKIGLDSYAEGLEMADLSELPILLSKEDCEKFHVTPESLVEFEDAPVEIIPNAEIGTLLQEFDTVFEI